MEIIHLILGKANPERMNGVNKVVYQLACNQHKFGKKVSVWGITHDVSVNFSPRPFETILFPASKIPFRIDTNLKKEILSKKNIAIFHLHGGWIPIYYSLSLFLKQNNIPYVYTPHGAYNTIAMKKNKFLKQCYYSLFEKTILEGAQTIHCIGESEVSGLLHFYPTCNKIRLLPYGIDFKSTALKSLRYSKKFIVGFVGRIDIYTKGLDILIESFIKFLKIKPESELWIIGGGSDFNCIKHIIKKRDLINNVLLYGPKYGDEKDNLISRMDVFVHSSRNEGLPNSVLEACNLGIPCIVSYATNLGEYVKKYNSGFLIQNESTQQLLKALLACNSIRNKEIYMKLKNNAINMVKDGFNWNNLIYHYDNLYINK